MLRSTRRMFSGVVGGLLLSLLLVAPALTTGVAAQGLTDLGVHLPPAGGQAPYSPPGSWLPGAAGFPAQGATYVDPVFGTTIRRVTDGYPGIGDSTLYARNGFWNADGTRIFHDPDASGSHDIVDATTGAIVRGGVPAGVGEVSFDPNFPDVYYYFSGNTVRKYLLSTGVSVTVKDFQSALGALGGSVDYIDVSGRYFVLNLNGAARVWDAIDGNGRLPGDPAYVAQAAGTGLASPGDAGHGGLLSGSFAANFGGGYIGITPSADGVFMTTSNVSWHALDLGAKTLASAGVNRTPDWNGADHGDVVSASDGNSYFIGINCCMPDWAVMRWNLTQGGASMLLVHVGSNNNDEHFSGIPRGVWRDWMAVDLESNASGNGDLGLWEPFHQEVFMVNVLTGAVRRLAHHRSQNATAQYTWMPRISANWDGTKIAFLSNHGFLQNGYADLWTVDTGTTTNNPVPAIGALAPTSVLAGVPGLTLTVNGSNFVASSGVRWNGTNRATTFASSTQLRATILATDVATVGTAQVTVVTPAPGGGTSNALTFTITSGVSLAVVRAGTGSGTVTSVPAGISCGTNCSSTFASGTPVVLTAAPAAGSTFTGWSGGGCTGTGTCTVTLTAPTTVTATFSTPSFALTVTKAGTGLGTVTSSPAGINCGATCSAPYTSGTVVSLTAAPGSGSAFTGWSGGGCGGTGTCTITMSAATTATATFALDTTPPAVAITSPTTGSTYTTSNSPLTLGGTASDNVGLRQVTWANSRGGSGMASGTTSWTASGIVLQLGTNMLTVTAQDAAGNTATASLTVTFTDATPPTVALTAPASGTTVTGRVPVSASASDDVGVVGVQFQLDATNLGAEVTAAPFAIVWDSSTTTAGAHTLTAVARDAAGNRTTSTAVGLTVALPPAPDLLVYRAGTPITVDGALGEWSGAGSASFSGTSNGAVAYLLWDDTNLYVAFRVSDTQLNATQTARDAASIYLDDAVEILIDANNNRTAAMQPDDYQFIVNLNNIQADLRGTGSGKDQTWDAIWRSAVLLQGTLNNNADTDTGHTVEVAIPWAQLGVTPVSGMQFGMDLAVDDSDPTGATTYETFDWAQIAPGSYAQPSLWKQVRLVGTPPSGDTTAPSVAITSPTAGTTVSGTVTVTAAASDNVGVVGVQFKLDGANLGAEDTTTPSPYSVSWNTTTAADGTHALTAVARDAAGNTATASTVSVTVRNSTFSLSVVKSGSGSGTVTSAPAGISCGTSCSASFTSGSAVTLTASPAAGSAFTGWSGGGCSGTGTCIVTVSAATTVTATFTLQTVTLTVSKAGTGTGTVTSSPTGINCGATCSASLTSGTVVTLSATPGASSTFTGWSGGGCSGTGTCTVTLTAATTVSATFTGVVTQATLWVSVRGSGKGMVTSNPSGVACTGSCSAVYPTGTTVTLAASAGSGASFNWWNGSCSGSGPCTIVMSGVQSVKANFSATFTNPTPTAGTSLIGAADITELRSAINTIRTQNFGLAPFAFSDPTISVGAIPVKAVHFIELRAALIDAYVQAGIAPPIYTDPVITPGVTVIRAVDLTELRSAMSALP